MPCGVLQHDTTPLGLVYVLGTCDKSQTRSEQAATPQYIKTVTHQDREDSGLEPVEHPIVRSLRLEAKGLWVLACPDRRSRHSVSGCSHRHVAGQASVVETGVTARSEGRAAADP